MISLNHITKIFRSGKDPVCAVDDVSLDIHQGEVFGIIGFSGAGKSTLVRCINLLERPTEGTVTVDGQELTSLSEKELRRARRKIGMIFQHFNLMASGTVYDNIAFPLRKSPLSPQEKREKIASLLELIGLSDRADAYPSQLSGGQKQRVAIARALACDPKVLLCDEATSALDPQTTKSILALLRKLNEEMGITIVLITHEMAVVKDICDRVAIMENGHVAEEGLTSGTFANPRETVTRNFINTADNMDKIYDMVKENDENLRIKSGEKLVMLTYCGECASEAVISQIASIYNVHANIVYGNIDILKGQTVGKLIVALQGEAEKMKSAIDYIREKNVKLEVIRE